MYKKPIKIVALFLVLLVSSGIKIGMAAMAEETFSEFVNIDGDISLPQYIRENMVHLGSWFVPEGGASGFHDVYTEAESAKVFQETGIFPDGATVIKELRAADSGDYSTGTNVRHENTVIKQWFVMVKDSEGRFEDNPAWGDGWGWALFFPGVEAPSAVTDYRTDCLGCHIPAQENDWIFVEGYPSFITP
jgi:hypothetical protein